ncbi:MAG: restriction endonuclease subunit S [Carboxydocellales bacterium]
MRQEIKDRIEKIRNGEVPEGYANKKSGVYPDIWNEKSLKDLCSVVDYRGKTPVKTEEGIFLLTAKNVKEGKIDYQVSKEYISSSEYEEVMRRGTPKIGDVVITTEAPLGNVAQIDNERIAIAQRVIKLRGNESIISNEYLKYFLFSDNFQSELDKESTGSTVKGIKGSRLKKLNIVFCQISEQQKIASILSIWDKAIELKKQLIEQKKEQKRGLMKKLLIGEVRLPGFDGEWKEVKLSEIAYQSTLKNTGNLDIRVLSCTKYDGLVDSLEYFGRKMFSDDISKYKIVKKGQVCYATNHIEEGSIGIMNKFDVGLVSPMYTVFEVNSEHDSNYVFQVLKSERYVELYKSLMSASVNRRGSLRWNEFSEIKITCPTYEEQKSIANFINFVNYNIDLLQQELESLKLQKKGLMQMLLTGIVRVQN